MARQIEASYNWLENLVYQCQVMNETEAMLKLGGAIAGLKAQATVTFEFCAREASQIFGGLSYSRGGQGAKVSLCLNPNYLLPELTQLTGRTSVSGCARICYTRWE